MANRASIIGVAFALSVVLLGGIWFAIDTPRGVVNQDSEAAPAHPASPRALKKVAALGRIEPRDGVIRVAGPPRTAVVIQELRVKEGDWVQRGQVVAVLQGSAVERAEVLRLEAELANAQQELDRNQALFRKRTLSDSDLRAFELDRDVAAAALQRAQAELELSSVHAPIDGQVIDIHAREGERVDQAGIIELGDTSAMYAVAEVYETDIDRIGVGQHAVVRSPVFPHPLAGEVERIGLKVGKKDVLNTDPVADADARVVEVHVRLSEPALAAKLSNLRVEVVFDAIARVGGHEA
jgi:multidrug efflux pump subunit AcrA (membrane-fusion protein)